MSSLPYENTSSGEKALVELQKALRAFGCNRFGSMVDDDAHLLLVQFSYRGRDVSIRASMAGYAEAWLKAHPYTSRMRRSKAQHERKAMEIANTAVYSIVRDWAKGQIMAVETGVLSFEGAFLGQILLASGRTLLEEVADQQLLPSPREDS